MDREPDTVIGKPVLWKVVGANLFAAVTGTNHRSTFLRQRLLLLIHLNFVKPGTQDAHPLLPILDL